MSGTEMERIVEQVRQSAIRAEQVYGGCGQATLRALQTVLDIPDAVLTSAHAFQAGIAATGMYACGAVCGGLMAISCFAGRHAEDFETYEDEDYKDLMLLNRFVRTFQKQYHGVNCADVQTEIMGRPYNLLKEYDAFLEAGGHDDKCPNVCAYAAELVIRVLDQAELLEGALKK